MCVVRVLYIYLLTHDLSRILVLHCYYILILERSVLQRQQDQKQQAMLNSDASSREELQQNLIVQMKSVTGAGDDVCVSTLESNGYDLKTSIEAYYVKR
jgi:hypothetical protein